MVVFWDNDAWSDAQAQALGATIRNLRLDEAKRPGDRLSQEALAYQAGLTKNQVHLIEQGRTSGRTKTDGPSNPRMSSLAGIARVFDMKMSELLDAAGL
jgi:transcriptional regulator with XRE-family HTH domain